jgi:hypothetical protein
MSSLMLTAKVEEEYWLIMISISIFDGKSLQIQNNRAAHRLGVDKVYLLILVFTISATIYGEVLANRQSEPTNEWAIAHAKITGVKACSGPCANNLIRIL